MKKNENEIMTTNYCDSNEVYIECIEKNRGEINISESPRIRLFFVTKGSCSFFCAKHFDVKLDKGYVVIVPPKSKCIMDVKNNIQIITIHLTVDLNFCSDFPFEALIETETEIEAEAESNTKKKKKKRKAKTAKAKKDEVAFLKINRIIFDYLKHMRQCLAEGIKSAEFFQLKQKELLYYFGECYSREELYAFFYPILTNDIDFSKKVYIIYENVNSVTEMAKVMNYSLSGFKKRFERVFGMTAYNWLCQEKAKKLFHAITCSRQTFTQLSYDFGFSSPAHMNNFCRKMFGDTPGNIRAKTISQKS